MHDFFLVMSCCLMTKKNHLKQKLLLWLHILFNNTNRTKAEIYWLLKCSTVDYSNNSCNNMAELFQNMFPDSDIAKKFQLGPNKEK